MISFLSEYFSIKTREILNYVYHRKGLIFLPIETLLAMWNLSKYATVTRFTTELHRWHLYEWLAYLATWCFDHEDEKNTRHSVLTREKDILLGLVEAKTHMIVQNYNYAS